MFEIEKIIKKTSSPIFHNSTLFIVRVKTKGKVKESKLTYLDPNLEVLWESPENNVYGKYIYDQYLFYSTSDFQLICRSIYNLKDVIYTKKLKTHLLEKYILENILLIINKEYLATFDLSKGSILGEVEENRGVFKGVVLNNFIALATKNDLNQPSSILEINDIGLNKLWTRDFSKECKYIDPWDNNTKPGFIEHIYQYDDCKIIVCCRNSFSFCLNAKTGEEIWKSDYSSQMIFNGDTGFSYSNGGSIAKIDLNTGLNKSTTNEYYYLPDLPNIGDDYVCATGNTMAYFNGLLWYLVLSNGYALVVAINMFDWRYEWIQRVNTKGELMSIKFNENKMYLTNSVGDLIIYKKS